LKVVLVEGKLWALAPGGIIVTTVASTTTSRAIRKSGFQRRIGSFLLSVKMQHRGFARPGPEVTCKK
jgi:hypothetical protein